MFLRERSSASFFVWQRGDADETERTVTEEKKKELKEQPPKTARTHAHIQAHAFTHIGNTRTQTCIERERQRGKERGREQASTAAAAGA